MTKKHGTVETYDKKSYDKKSRPSIFDLWTMELSNFVLKIGFLVENCIYIYSPNIRNDQTLGPKTGISYRMSPPYMYKLASNSGFMCLTQ